MVVKPWTMDPTKPFPIFFAPEGDAPSTLGNPGGIEVPVIPASIPSVTEVILGDNPAVENSPAVRAVPKETTKGPGDFGMESPDESAERAGLKERARGEDGKFIKKDGTTQPTTPVAKPPAKPVAKAPAAPAKPAVAKAVIAPTPPAEPAKVKIGNEEKTPAEWEAHFKALEAKANPPAISKTPEPEPDTPEQVAAAQKQRETDFITKTAEKYLMPELEYDQLLAGGPAGIQKFATLLATAEMRGRQFSADKLTELADHFEARLAELSPIRESHARIQTLMEETQFLNSNEDIKTHPQGLDTFRKISGEMNAGYEAIKAKIDAGTATKSEQGWALQFEDLSPDKLKEAFAEHTRIELAKLPAPAAAVTPPVAAPASSKPAAPVEKPLSSVRPGGTGTPRSETPEQRLVREVNQQRGIAA